MPQKLRVPAIIAALVLLAAGAYLLPPVQQRLGWRIANLVSRVHYALNPPDRASLAPRGLSEADLQTTLSALVTQQWKARPAPTRSASAAVQPGTATAAAAATTPAPSKFPITETPAAPVPTLLATRTLPAKVSLQGIRYEYQSFNNCGPANLAMALSFWGWQGDQRNTKTALRPNDDDANVMPEEMAAYAAAQPGLKAILRVGGDLPMLKRLVAAGFPVLIETGHQPPKDWWMGHYVLVSGYDDAYQALITQDSLIMPDFPLPYKDIQADWWRDFNFIYLIITPAERESEALALLGADADPGVASASALQRAREESAALSGRAQFFALFNQGDLLLAQGDFKGAAQVYDLAFGVYNTLADEQRPWRTLWYRPGPYQAYYQTGRYADVITLANSVLSMLSKRGLEESHYWRGMAYAAQGETAKAADDFKIALALRPTYAEAAEALSKAGK